MAILHLQQINKRDQLITLDTGDVLSMTVEKMFQVNVYLGDEVAGLLRFEALSTLNNIELSPIYKLIEESLDHPSIIQDAKEIRAAAIKLYKSYTNGAVRDIKQATAIH